MIRAVLSIGSNMEDRYRFMNTVVQEFADTVVARSGIYATPPWGVRTRRSFSTPSSSWIHP